MIKKLCMWYLRITETPVFLNLETVDGDINLAAKKGPVFLSADRWYRHNKPLIRSRQHIERMKQKK